MEKAREIQKFRIRQERVDQWPVAHAAWNMPADAGNQAALDEAAAFRQKFRAAPDHLSIDAASTPGALAICTMSAILEAT